MIQDDPRNFADVVFGVQQLDAHQGAYLEAEQTYEGTTKEIFANPRVEQDLAKTGDKYRFNLARRVVSTVSNRLKLSGVSVVDNDVASKTLEEIRTANDMGIYDAWLIERALVYGDYYYLVWPVDADDDSEDEDIRSVGVTITPQSPLSVRMIYADDNPKKPAYAVKSWTEGKRRRADLYYRDRVERFITVKDNAKGYKPNEWEIFSDPQNEDEPGVIFHPFDEIPVVHFRTDLPYGRSELADAIGPQRAIQKALVTLINTLETHGYPVRYGLVDPQAILDINNDDPDWSDENESPGATPAEMSGGLRTGPGVFQRFQGMKEVGQFNAAEPKVFLEPVLSFIRLMAMATETPAYELNPSGDQPSGEARRQADEPLVHKVEKRKMLLKAPFSQVYRVALKAVGVIVPAVQVQFAPTSSINDRSGWETIKAKQDAGVPVKQTLLEAGYSEKEVDSWLDELPHASFVKKVEILGKIATALRDLGTAVTLNVITPERLDEIVESLVGSLSNREEDE